MRLFVNFLLKNTIFKNRFISLYNKKKLYKNVTLDSDIYSEQINRFNKQWERAYTNISFYKSWKEIHNLPDYIESISELRNFPIITKDIINQNFDLILSDLQNYYFVSTGGTSGVTTYFPTSKIDGIDTYANAYLGRSWWGIKPFSRILMFWGHSHLFGSGVRMVVKKSLRNIQNFIINTKRISSYSLNEKNIYSFYKAINKTNPETIISYSSNIFKIVKYMKSNKLNLKSGLLRNIIVTSESAYRKDVELIKSQIDVNIINEYGMAETGVIAYSYKHTNNIKVMWDSFIVTINDSGNLFITSISNRMFPLFNYDSEDLATIKHEYEGSVLSISSIDGKVRNILKIPTIVGHAVEISTIFFDHILKHYPDIYSVQYHQLGNGIEIMVSSDIDLNLDSLKDYTKRESKKELDSLDFNKIFFIQGDSLKTVAGKHKVIY